MDLDENSLRAEFENFFKKIYYNPEEYLNLRPDILFVLSHGREETVYTPEYRESIQWAKKYAELAQKEFHVATSVALTGDPLQDAQAARDLKGEDIIFLSWPLYPNDKNLEGLNTKVQFQKIAAYISDHPKIKNILILTRNYHGPRTMRYGKKYLSSFSGKVHYAFTNLDSLLTKKQRAELIEGEISRIIEYSQKGDL